jgi:hypothetical protein
MAVALFVSVAAMAHGGGLNADGCHTNRKTGDYVRYGCPGEACFGGYQKRYRAGLSHRPARRDIHADEEREEKLRRVLSLSA